MKYLFTIIVFVLLNLIGNVYAEPVDTRPAPPPVESDQQAAPPAAAPVPPVQTQALPAPSTAIKFTNVENAKQQKYVAEQALAASSNKDPNLQSNKDQQAIVAASDRYINAAENQTSVIQKGEARVTVINEALASLESKTDPASEAKKKGFEAELYMLTSQITLATAQVKAASSDVSCSECTSIQKEIDNYSKTMNTNQAVASLYSANNALAKTITERTAAGASPIEINRYVKEQEYNNTLIACTPSCDGDSADQKAAKAALSEAQYNLSIAKSNLANEQQLTIAKDAVHLCNWGICMTKKKTSVDELAQNIIRFLARTIGALAVMTFMVGGLMLIIRIDDDGRAKGKKMMQAAVISILIVLSAYVIVTFVMQILYSLGK